MPPLRFHLAFEAALRGGIGLESRMRNGLATIAAGSPAASGQPIQRCIHFLDAPRNVVDCCRQVGLLELQPHPGWHLFGSNQPLQMGVRLLAI